MASASCHARARDRRLRHLSNVLAEAWPPATASLPGDPYCHFPAPGGVESLQSISQSLRNRTVWERLDDTVASYPITRRRTQYRTDRLAFTSYRVAAVSAAAGNAGGSTGARPTTLQTAAARPRARQLGIWPGHLPTGQYNAITDVPGVLVGQVTLQREDGVNTGGTAVLPHSGALFDDKVPAAAVVGNGFGKLAGTTQVDELGEIETPVLLTNTLAVGNGMQAVIDYTLDQPGNEDVRSVNAVVGETNDGGLNDIRAHYNLTPQLLRESIDSATSGPVSEGAVGAGAGTMCYSLKGGIGTSSRCVHMGGEASYAHGR
jgi:hypothetical protein